MDFSVFRNHFQVAYVVNDMDAAIRRFADEFKVPAWSVLSTPAKGGAMRKFAGCYSGDLMFELIEPDPEIPSIFRDFLPETPGGFRLHHFGYMIHDPEEFAAAIVRLDECGYGRAHSGSFGEVLDFHIADTTAAFGHYHELILSKAKGEAFFGAMPRN
jgi:catechol 2,3-dioxygenase-like lactoylglutathione lyase family enzyme